MIASFIPVSIDRFELARIGQYSVLLDIVSFTLSNAEMFSKVGSAYYEMHTNSNDNELSDFTVRPDIVVTTILYSSIVQWKGIIMHAGGRTVDDPNL